MQPDPSADPDVRVHVVLKRNPNARKPPKQSGDTAEPPVEPQQNNQEQNLREPIRVEPKSQILTGTQEKSEAVETPEIAPASPAVPLAVSDPRAVEMEPERSLVIESDTRRRSSSKPYLDSDDEPLDDFTYDANSF